MTALTTLTSVLEDAEPSFLPRLIDFYCPGAQTVIDLTWGGGRWWLGSKYRVTGIDRYSAHPPIRADWNAAPFRDGCADVIVYDPPHASEGGQSGQLQRQYTTVKTDNHAEVVWLVLPKIRRLLKPDGILLVKIADQVNRGRFQWQLVELVNRARAAGLTPCDCYVKVRKSPMFGGHVTGAKVRSHVPKRHCYWVVLRPGSSCYPPDAQTGWLKAAAKMVEEGRRAFDPALFAAPVLAAMEEGQCVTI